MLKFICEESGNSDLETMRAKLEKLRFEETIPDSFYKNLGEDCDMKIVSRYKYLYVKLSQIIHNYGHYTII